MGLPRTYVGFSSTDIHCFHLMLAWKEHQHIEFDFANFQFDKKLNSENEDYIRQRCQERIDMAGTFALLIGEDTASKRKYVRWEIEAALEKKRRIIAINLDGARQMVKRTCPPVLDGAGAIFVPFSPRIVAYALNEYTMQDSGNHNYPDEVYAQLGYVDER